MTERYEIHGALGSPYSLKVRAALRYRRLPHIWIHGMATQGGALAHVKAPVIPVVRFPEDSWHNDSTPLLHELERRHPGDRSIIPPDPVRAFLAALIEDFADEWLTKAMFGYRWLEDVDQIQMSRWLAFDALKGGGLELSQRNAEIFRQRQVSRMAIVGCTAENFPLIEASTRAVLAALETHVVARHCLFGTCPSLAEFGIYGQFSQLGVDPTAQDMMRADYPYTFRWLAHIDDMSGIDGEWDDAGAPLPPVIPAILKVIGEVYLPFLIANAQAVASSADEVRIEAMGLSYVQGPFKYQVKCLNELRAQLANLQAADRAQLDPLLEQSGCLVALTS